ncbi:zinc finger protein 852-like [Condylostylus longicornis]|uniref:zinc finger protein 852-like n=1 Tax=Condylostylus longicornis TaxID=2530218 RepID=UPI00244E1290|nr:zinc finger protein 852-like [Condylostylus longicornis]XP_055389145.1 zinc finger protein 852-like [Condylostylus longicornis]
MCDTNENIWRNLCRFCGAQSYKNLEEPLDKNFLDVVDKLFSFSVETLNIFKICIVCETFIDSICKFYIQVKSVSKIFSEIENSIKEEIPINIVQLNSKYSSGHDQIKNFDNQLTRKIVGNIKKNSESIKIENNPIKETSSNCNDSNEKSNHDIIDIIKQEIYEEKEDTGSCIENKIIKTEIEYDLSSDSESGFLKVKNIKKLQNVNEKTPSKRKCKCETCGKRFSNNSNLLEHRKLHWPAEKKEANFFKCPHCDARYPRKGKMLIHVRTKHLKERPFVCQICNKEFSSNHHLVRHKRNIHDKNESTCPICQKQFASSRIEEHIKNHEKNCVPCTVCGDLFKPKHLGRHMLVHSDVKDYRCNYCGRSFKRNITLQFHMITHTNLKPFSCRFCNHSFVHPSNRKRHEEVMHPNELKSNNKDFHENDKKLPSIEELHKMLENLKGGRENNFHLEENKELKM